MEEVGNNALLATNKKVINKIKAKKINKKSVDNRVVKIRLTERDFEIFQFLLDQKFASLEALYFRFFDQRSNSNEQLPKELYVARQRLGILKKAGFVNTEKVYSESKSLYLLTNLGFSALSTKFPSDAYATPILKVDFRSYEHDKGVNFCRAAIEKEGRCQKWFSERRLRMHGFEMTHVSGENKLPESVIPDGIFISSKSVRVAFELEASPRKISRYIWKIREYKNVLMGDNPLLHKVMFVAATDRIYEDLKKAMALEYVSKDEFILENYSHFLARLFPAANALKVNNALSQAIRTDYE